MDNVHASESTGRRMFRRTYHRALHLVVDLFKDLHTHELLSLSLPLHFVGFGLLNQCAPLTAQAMLALLVHLQLLQHVVGLPR